MNVIKISLLPVEFPVEFTLSRLVDLLTDKTMSEANGKTPDIFSYRDYREFLRAFCKTKKSAYGNLYSFRNLSRQMGFNSANYLLLIAQGQRNLQPGDVSKLCHVLKLDPRQTKFFKCLVSYTQETNQSKKYIFYKKISAFPETGITGDVAEHSRKYFSAWYHPVIREMVRLNNFCPDPEWIARHISPKISVEQARESIRMQQEIGLVKTDGDGKWQQATPQITSSQSDITPDILRYHRSMIRLSEDSLNLPRHERKITAMTMSLSRENQETILKKIEDFKIEIQAIVTSAEPSKEQSDPIASVYQLNLSFFKMAGAEDS